MQQDAVIGLLQPICSCQMLDAMQPVLHHSAVSTQVRCEVPLGCGGPHRLVKHNWQKKVTA